MTSSLRTILVGHPFPLVTQGEKDRTKPAVAVCKGGKDGKACHKNRQHRGISKNVLKKHGRVPRSEPRFPLIKSSNLVQKIKALI